MSGPWSIGQRDVGFITATNLVADLDEHERARASGLLGDVGNR